MGRAIAALLPDGGLPLARGRSSHQLERRSSPKLIGAAVRGSRVFGPGGQRWRPSVNTPYSMIASIPSASRPNTTMAATTILTSRLNNLLRDNAKRPEKRPSCSLHRAQPGETELVAPPRRRNAAAHALLPVFLVVLVAGLLAACSGG